MRDTWTIEEAEEKLRRVVAKARSSVPQTITRNGRPIAVVVSTRAWNAKNSNGTKVKKSKRKRKGSLVEFFANSPLRNSGLVIDRHNFR
jgi:prevent-host-death family protein